MTKSQLTLSTGIIILAAYGLQLLTYSGIWFLEMPFARTPQACAASASVTVSHVCKCTIVEHHAVGFPFRANYNDECEQNQQPVVWILAIDYALQALFLVSLFVIMQSIFMNRSKAPRKHHSAHKK